VPVVDGSSHPGRADGGIADKALSRVSTARSYITTDLRETPNHRACCVADCRLSGLPRRPVDWSARKRISSRDDTGCRRRIIVLVYAAWKYSLMMQSELLSLARGPTSGRLPTQEAEGVDDHVI
jgi:hypothetical protein